MVLETKFHYYPANVYITKPLGVLTLKQLIESIRNPKPEVKERFDLIRTEKDKAKRDEYKSKLFAFTPSAMTDGLGRSHDNIKSFTGLAVVEWDNIQNIEEAHYLKQYIFRNYKCCATTFLSPSGKGVKAIFKIPVAKDIDEYKEYYYGLEFELRDLIDVKVDLCNEKPLQLLYLSYDPNILFREDPTEWTKKTWKTGCFKQVKVQIDSDKEPTEESTRLVLHFVNKFIDRFEGENGHGLVVKASTTLGGYIAGGEISYEDAENYMFNLIETHWYLMKKGATYKKTALRFLLSGQNGPLTLDN